MTSAITKKAIELFFSVIVLSLMTGPETVVSQTIVPIDGELKPKSQVNLQLTNEAEVASSDRSPSFSPEAKIAVEEIEREFGNAFAEHLGINKADIISLEKIQALLGQVEETTGYKPGLLYINFPTNSNLVRQPAETLWAFNSRQQPSLPLPISQKTTINEQLKLMLVTASEVIRQPVEKVTREEVLAVVQELQRTVTNARRPRAYLASSQKLYQWLIAPLEEDLQAHEIKTLVFILDEGLRSVPLAALHDGHQFLVERYSIAIMPTLSLTDTRRADFKNQQVLAMGAAEFTEQNPLPAVPIELSLIAGELWQGKFFLNEDFTLNNFQQAYGSKQFRLIHLATHANFERGAINRSYIQFWQDKLTLEQLKQLNLGNPPVELLVLSACRTALGDREAELGFAGAAALAKVKSVVGSLWEVSDEGTLGLMTGFYTHLKATPLKAEALRQAQLSLLKGEVGLVGGQLMAPEGTFPLPPQLANLGDKKLSHPYYWSSFTMIGSPW